MSEEASHASGEHEKVPHVDHAPAQQVLGKGLYAPEILLPPATPTLLPGDPRLNGRGNQPVRIAVMQRMQQIYGNRAVVRLLKRVASYSPIAPPAAPDLQPKETIDEPEELSEQPTVELAPDAPSPAPAQRIPDGVGAATAQRQPIEPAEEAKGLSLGMLSDPTNIQPLQRQAPPTVQPQPTDPLRAELEKLIANATWEKIRKRIYSKESAEGMQRTKDRKEPTLPNLTGLGQITTIDHFAEAVRTLQRDWKSLSKNERLKKLGEAANVELETAKVPKFLTVGKESMVPQGYFSPSEWKYMINKKLVSGDVLSDDAAEDIVNTTLHESRHAEQDFLAARYAAGHDERTAEYIKDVHGIPLDIANDAVEKKIMGTSKDQTVAEQTEANLSEKMHKSTVTDGDHNQTISDDVTQAIKDLDKKRRGVVRALRKLDGTPQRIANATAKRDALRAQITVLEKKYTLYRKIPHEEDAHIVGDAAENLFKVSPKPKP